MKRTTLIFLAPLVPFLGVGYAAPVNPQEGQEAPMSHAESMRFEELPPAESSLNLDSELLVKVPARPAAGFNYPYYLFVPKTIDQGDRSYLYVEPNNTGQTSDDQNIHDQSARRLAEKSYASWIAKHLRAPLLVPVFPRPERPYTHYLNRDTLLVPDGPLKRIDLQIGAMIDDAQRLLKNSGVLVNAKVFMHGFSSSSGFVLRYTILHPERVRAVAAGGVNALPIFPVPEWKETPLRYALGIADLEQVAGIKFDRENYLKVAKYIYMGYLDHNDTTNSTDCWAPQDAETIRRVLGAKMIPDRWNTCREIFESAGVPVQLVTYNGTGHTIKPEMEDDLVRFFDANRGIENATIQPHEYPFVENQENKIAHITAIRWAGDAAIPEFARSMMSHGHFILCIDEWIKDQNYTQLREFRSKAGFQFVLKAEDGRVVAITPKNGIGSTSSGDGSFQGWVVRLSDEQLAIMTPGGRWTVEPVDNDSGYEWKVAPGLAVVRPSK